ncbi:hypothetical protein LXL04_009936 [Taraxacum kok-saghyz]
MSATATQEQWWRSTAASVAIRESRGRERKRAETKFKEVVASTGAGVCRHAFPTCFNTADTQFAGAKMKDDSAVVVDDAVEVYGREEDRCLCFYAATIVSLFETDAEVRFVDLKTEDNKPIVEKIGLEYIRPRPVNFSFDFKCGDAINVWIKDRWWLGKFVARVRRSQAVCLIFKAGREETGPQFQKQIYYENESRTYPVPSSNKDQATIRTCPMHPKHPQVDSCQPKCHTPKPGLRRKRLGAGDVIQCHIERPPHLDGNAEFYHQQRHSHNMVPIPILLFDSRQKKKAKYYNQNQITYITRPKIEIIGWNVVSDISTI